MVYVHSEFRAFRQFGYDGTVNRESFRKHHSVVPTTGNLENDDSRSSIPHIPLIASLTLPSFLASPLNILNFPSSPARACACSIKCGGNLAGVRKNAVTVCPCARHALTAAEPMRPSSDEMSRQCVEEDPGAKKKEGRGGEGTYQKHR